MIPSALILLFINFLMANALQLDEFYPYNNEDVKEQISANDDASSRPIALLPPLNFYGRSYNECWVHNNGVVALNKPPGHFLDEPFPLDNYTLIAPFYGDVDTREAGTVWFTDPVTKNKEMLLKAEQDIHCAFSDYEQFSPTYLIIATWDHVGYYKERDDKLNTFQCIIATDGNLSFAMFLYNETIWTSPYESGSLPKYAKVGFNEGNIKKSWEVPCSRSMNVSEVSMTSNVGVSGKWVFRIDEEILSACSNESYCENDELCSCLTKDPNHKCQCSSSSVEDLDSPVCMIKEMEPLDSGASVSGPNIITLLSAGVLLLVLATNCERIVC